MPIVFYGEVVYFFDMKIYLDNRSLQRPLDDRKQVRIMLEAERFFPYWPFVNPETQI